MQGRLQAIKNEQEHTCPYKKDRVRKVFAIHAVPVSSPRSNAKIIEDSVELHSMFLPLGLTGGTLHVMGNDCASCNACVPLRINAAAYKPSRHEEKILHHNKDLKLSLRPTSLGTEHHALFLKYLSDRHPENTNNRWPENEFLGYMQPHTHMIEIRKPSGPLIGCVVFDVMNSGINAFQLFYDPDESTARRSLGTYSYLLLVELAQAIKCDHIYIGDWVSGSPKLDYKKKFQHLETLAGGAWVPFNPQIHTSGPDLKKAIPPNIPWVTEP